MATDQALEMTLWVLSKFVVIDVVIMLAFQIDFKDLDNRYDRVLVDELL